jgi:UDP-2,3-diacylglucosamine hydrolase
MPRALFASDLHLCASRPVQAARFFALLERAPGQVDTVYLLGDLVEFWPGDDDDDALHRQLVQALRSLTLAGVGLAVITGNRDFLMQSRFARETGAELLPDYHRVELAGIPTLLTHGDLLCTRDVQYLQFRETVRAPARQAQFLGLPLEERRRIATATRAGTQQSMSAKDDYIMDAEETEIMRVMRLYGVQRLVHGHTHRPAIHHFELDGVPCERVVLGDWYEGDLVYLCEPSANRLVSAETLLSLWS